VPVYRIERRKGRTDRSWTDPGNDCFGASGPPRSSDELVPADMHVSNPNRRCDETFSAKRKEKKKAKEQDAAMRK
jgi:hypothetical protein